MSDERPAARAPRTGRLPRMVAGVAVEVSVPAAEVERAAKAGETIQQRIRRALHVLDQIDDLAC